MMKSVQDQKIAETMELLIKHFQQKDLFMKDNIPVQEQLIQKIQQAAQLTLSSLVTICSIIRQQKQSMGTLCQSFQKSPLVSSGQKAPSTQKLSSSGQSLPAWNNNISRVLSAMSASHSSKLASLKTYQRVLDTSYQQLSKEEMIYRSEIKHLGKEISTALVTINTHSKEENKILMRVIKEAKSKDLKDSLYFLSEVKKAEGLLFKEIELFVERSTKVLEAIKAVVKNQKKCSKRLKEILTNLYDKKKEIMKESSQDGKLFGVLTVLQDGIQQSRQLYLEKTLISPQMVKQMSRLTAPQQTKIHQTISYLSLGLTQLQKSQSFFSQIRFLPSNLSFKTFPNISLAQGWLITSYTPAIAYLTFDHYLLVYDTQGTVLKKILSTATSVDRVGDRNVVYLKEKKKGIFTDGLEEYQIMFDSVDRMEEFILFIENQIK